MARGWESKSIESQQEAARENVTTRARTGEQRVRDQRRQTLELTRASAAADLHRATSAPHRAMLEQAIATLDGQLAELES